jgi:cell wall-associated NlpC family hydrolase
MFSSEDRDRIVSTEDRDRIVAEARGWLNTPYRGWSRMKRYGCDCIGFIAGVFINTGYISEEEATEAIPKDYSLQIGQHQEDTEYIDGIEKFMREITEAEALPGDVVMYKLSLAFSHSGLVVRWPMIIHSLAHGGVRYTDGKRHPTLAGRAIRFFTLRDEVIQNARLPKVSPSHLGKPIPIPMGQDDRR